MSTQEITNLLVSLSIPLITTLAGVVGVMFQDRRARRSDAGRRKLALEDAREQVNFASDWLAASRALGRSQGDESAAADRASRWLESASTLVSTTELPLARAPEPLTFRRLALLYPFTSPAAKTIRLGFYVFSGWTLLILGTSTSQRLSHESNRAGWVKYDLAIGSIVAAIGLLLRFLAVAVQRNSTEKISLHRPDGGVFRSAFLLCRLRARAARTIRLLFYADLILVGYCLRASVRTAVGMWTLAWLPLGIAQLAVFGTAAIGIRAWALAVEAAAQPAVSPDPPGTVSSGWVAPVRVDVAAVAHGDDQRSPLPEDLPAP